MLRAAATRSGQQRSSSHEVTLVVAILPRQGHTDYGELIPAASIFLIRGDRSCSIHGADETSCAHSMLDSVRRHPTPYPHPRFLHPFFEVQCTMHSSMQMNFLTTLLSLVGCPSENGIFPETVTKFYEFRMPSEYEMDNRYKKAFCSSQCRYSEVIFGEKDR